MCVARSASVRLTPLSMRAWRRVSPIDPMGPPRAAARRRPRRPAPRGWDWRAAPRTIARHPGGVNRGAVARGALGISLAPDPSAMAAALRSSHAEKGRTMLRTVLGLFEPDVDVRPLLEELRHASFRPEE